MIRIHKMSQGIKARIHGFTSVKDGDVYLCPCCGREIDRADSRQHHVCEEQHGGHGYHWNVLLVCQSCHVTLHNGTKADRLRLNQMAHHFMGARYGMLFMTHLAKTIEKTSAKSENPRTIPDEIKNWAVLRLGDGMMRYIEKLQYAELVTEHLPKQTADRLLSAM